MNDPLPSNAPRLFRPALERIDRLCDRFEAAWKADQSLRIEDLLGEATGDEQAVLLEQLLLLELDFRQRRGEAPARKEYLARFPGQAAAVEAAFGRHETPGVSVDTWSQSGSSSRPSANRPSAVGLELGPGQVLGNYTLVEEIGAGGMGRVFKARHRTMERLAAIKVLSPECLKAPQAVERFKQEMKLVARLRHPNVVFVYEAGEEHGLLYLIMEYIEGSDLKELVKTGGPLPLDKALDYVLQAARGLKCAHQQGIVHRDVKPSNLVVDASGAVKLLDLGLARAVEPRDPLGGGDPSLTTSEQLLGTVDFMAPEQAANPHQADHRADIYSLGCTLHYLLVGRPPFGGRTVYERLRAHSDAPIPSLCAERPDVPETLDAVFQKMLAKDPAERYGSMTEAIAALESARPATEPPVQAREAGPPPVPLSPGVAEGVIAGRPLRPPLARRKSRAALWWQVVPLVVVVAVGLWTVAGWRPSGSGSTSQNAPLVAEPVPPPPAESPYADPELYQFLEKTFKDMKKKQVLRMIYTEIVTTAHRGDEGKWEFGAGLARDGNAFEIKVKDSAWFPKVIAWDEAVQRGLKPDTYRKMMKDDRWRLPERLLIVLSEPEVSAITTRDGRRMLIGGLTCKVNCDIPVEELTLVFEWDVPEEKGSREKFHETFQRIPTNRLPGNRLDVEIPIEDNTGLRHGGRFYLQGFVEQAPASVYRISNELVWPGVASQEDSRPKASAAVPK